MRIVSIKRLVERRNGELLISIPESDGGDILAPLAEGIGEVKNGALEVVLLPWLAQKLGVHEGDLVVVDNKNGKFTLTRATE